MTQLMCWCFYWCSQTERVCACEGEMVYRNMRVCVCVCEWRLMQAMLHTHTCLVRVVKNTPCCCELLSKSLKHLHVLVKVLPWLLLGCHKLSTWESSSSLASQMWLCVTWSYRELHFLAASGGTSTMREVTGVINNINDGCTSVEHDSR